VKSPCWWHVIYAWHKERCTRQTRRNSTWLLVEDGRQSAVAGSNAQMLSINHSPYTHVPHCLCARRTLFPAVRVSQTVLITYLLRLAMQLLIESERLIDGRIRLQPWKPSPGRNVFARNMSLAHLMCRDSRSVSKTTSECWKNHSDVR